MQPPQNTQNAKKILAVAIMGPTASGKTACALKTAQEIPSEIISVDSALVYREMNIGTAKPSEEELKTVPHHLINIRDPQEPYSVANFREDAAKLITEIYARGKLPLLVGGTMLYFKGLTEGLDELPNANPQIRAKLDEDARKIGWQKMHERLKELDPQTASRLKPNDTQRIQRALEIIEITGKPMSELLQQRKTNEQPFKFLNISLEPSDRTQLHKRIEQRFDKMLQNNALIEEVKKLRQRGNLNLGLPSMRCVGYRQVWEYLEGSYDKKTMRDKGIFATRQLAKRQLTWLRAMPERIIVDCLDENAPQKVLEIIRNTLKKEI